MFVPIIILKGEDKIQKEFDTNETHSKKKMTMSLNQCL